MDGALPHTRLLRGSSTGVTALASRDFREEWALHGATARLSPVGSEHKAGYFLQPRLMLQMCEVTCRQTYPARELIGESRAELPGFSPLLCMLAAQNEASRVCLGDLFAVLIGHLTLHVAHVLSSVDYPGLGP
jgi:hypothetical protein